MEHPLIVGDPFKAEISATRRRKVIGSLVLLTFLCFVGYVEYHRRVPAGPVVEGRIVAFRSATWDGQDVPVFVQLADGKTRVAVAPRSAIIGCKIGSRISLQLGSYVRVTPEGCRLS